METQDYVLSRHPLLLITEFMLEPELSSQNTVCSPQTVPEHMGLISLKIKVIIGIIFGEKRTNNAQYDYKVMA